ncbi:MAG: PA2169 family four-helix-bundle protein [Candidatus Binataceae bacterium]
MDTPEILHSLIATCVDSEKRYRHAAQDVERANLEAFLNRQADSRKNAAAALQAERHRLGIDEKKSGSISGFVDREALDFSVIMSKGDTGVIEWCREDDEKVIGQYQKALRETLPPDLRKTIENQLEQIRAAVVKEEDILRLFGGPKS